MGFSVSSINKFLFFKLPAAYWTGVRLSSISDTEATTTVRHRWVNQNPFRSMYFAVQAMAAELATGALVMKKISDCGIPISMLVAQNNAVFVKKAIGKISFICTEGTLVDEAIQQAIQTQEGVTVWMKSVGIDEKGDEVATFNFEWTLKVRIKK